MPSYIGGAGRDFLLQVPGEHSPVLALKIWVPPIPAGNRSPAARRSAAARHTVVVIIGGGPIVRQLLARSDPPQGHKYDLALDADIRIAGMIAEDHAAFPFVHAS